MPLLCRGSPFYSVDRTPGRVQLRNLAACRTYGPTRRFSKLLCIGGRDFFDKRHICGPYCLDVVQIGLLPTQYGHAFQIPREAYQAPFAADLIKPAQ